MSLHLFSKSDPDSPSRRSAHSPIALEESSDSEIPADKLSNHLQDELKREKTEHAKTKKQYKEQCDLLLQAQDGIDTLERKYDEAVRNFHKSTCKIRELEALCDRQEEEIAQLKSSLDVARSNTKKLNERLEISKSRSSLADIEKFELLEKIVRLEEEIGQHIRNAHSAEELLEEVDQLRTNNLNLKRELFVARNRGHANADDLVGEDDSPERMVFDQFAPDLRGGMNLRQELNMLGSPLIPTFSRGCQFPSMEHLFEGHDEFTQTEQIVVANASCQAEVPRSHASVQTVRIAAKTFATSSTQTTEWNQGKHPKTNDGIATALQRNHLSILPCEDSAEFPQPVFPPSSILFPSLNRWWIWVMAVMFLLIAYFGNRRVNVAPIVNLCKNGLRVQYEKGFPPH